MRRSYKKKSKSRRRSSRKSNKKCKECKKCKITSIKRCSCYNKSCRCYKLKIKKMFGVPPVSNTFIRGF